MTSREHAREGGEAGRAGQGRGGQGGSCQIHGKNSKKTGDWGEGKVKNQK